MPKYNGTVMQACPSNGCFKGTERYCNQQRNRDKLGCHGMSPGPRRVMCNSQAQKNYKNCITKHKI